ncbi:hypothetical protein H4R19_006138, partial [Coemansia spiralis]
AAGGGGGHRLADSPDEARMSPADSARQAAIERMEAHKKSQTPTGALKRYNNYHPPAPPQDPSGAGMSWPVG